MTKIIITQEQLNKFDGEKEWAVVDVLLNIVSEKVLMDYESGSITEDEVKLFDTHGKILEVYKYEIKA